MGILILIPSGILWNIIDKAKVIPKDTLAVVVLNVNIPSGMLWIINAILFIIPNL